MNNKKFLLGIDIDGVLRNFTDKMIEVYLRCYPTHTILTNKTYNLKYWTPIGEEINKFVFQTHAEEIYGNSLPYPNVSDHIKNLKNMGHDIIIVSTQPNKQIEDISIKWLSKHNIIYDEIYFTSEKEKVNIDLLLDDYVLNLNKVMNSGKIAVCYDRPYNEQWRELKVKDFNEFIDLVNNLSKSS